MKSFFFWIASHLPFYRELLQVKYLLEYMREDLERIRVALSQANEQLHSLRVVADLRRQEGYTPQRQHLADPKRLNGFEFQVNSQNGEDGILKEIFKRIGVDNTVFVEIGVGDGTENNTAFLLSQGWRGFWIDGRDTFLGTLKDRRDLSETCLQRRVSMIDKDNVAATFRELKVPEVFDLLSIDIDQNTYYVWEALHEYRPRVAVIEYNAAVPPDIDWKVNYGQSRFWDGGQNFGASLKSLEVLGSKLGYRLVGCDSNGVNAFFVRGDLVEDKFSAPFTSENHFEPVRYGYIARRGHRKQILDRSLDVTQG